MADPSFIEYRMDAVERAVEKIAEAVERIATSTAQLAQLEIRHAETRDGLERAFSEIEKLQAQNRIMESRIYKIEGTMPGLLEVKANINRALWGGAGVVGLAILGLVVVK